MKKNNKGFSLVELIIAFAIAAIAGTAVYGMMSVGGNNFRKTSNDVGLQYEQQIAVNQIRDYILESSDSIYYDEVEKSLFVFRQTVTTSTGSGTPSGSITSTAYEVTKLTFDTTATTSGEETAGGIIRYNQCVINSLTEDYKTLLSGTGSILASEVKDITYDLSKLSQGKVYFKITFLSQGKEISSEQVVSLRNTVVNSDELGSIFNTTRIEINSFIKSILIKREGNLITGSDTIGVIGDQVSVKYDAEVVASSSESERDYGVVWSISPETAGVSVDANTGLVTVVKADTPANEFSFTLVATSIDDPTKNAMIVINVDENGVYPKKAELVHDATNVIHGNGYDEYTFIPTIEYTGIVTGTESNILTGDAALDRIRWSIMEAKTVNGKTEYVDAELPSTKYDIVSGIDRKTGKLCLSSEANDKTYYIKYTVIQRKMNGEVLESNIIPLEVKNIKPYNVGAKLKLTVPSNAKRGTSFNMSLTWNGEGTVPAKMTYYFNVVPYTDNEAGTGTWYDATQPVATDFDSIVKIPTKDQWGTALNGIREMSDTTKYGGYTEGTPTTGWVETTNWNTKIVSASIEKYLDWSKAYKVKCIAYAVYDDNKGTKQVYDANGVHDYDPSKPVSIKPVEAIATISKVKFIVTPTQYMQNLKRVDSDSNSSTQLRTGTVLQPAPNNAQCGDRRAFTVDAVGYYVSDSNVSSKKYGVTSLNDMQKLNRYKYGNELSGPSFESTFMYFDNSGKSITSFNGAGTRIRNDQKVQAAQGYYFDIDVGRRSWDLNNIYDKFNIAKVTFYLTLVERDYVSVNGRDVAIINIAECETRYNYSVDRDHVYNAN